jgi:NAD(P)-dependent dehydrogenase (short-subunit alcohol dehydrogenase family)
MDLQLKSRTAFVSGSTQGIGFAIAKQLLLEGANVIINGRTPETVDTIVSNLKEQVKGASVSGIAADFGNVHEVERLLNALPEIDILINNVGIFEIKSFVSIEDEDWENIIEVNVMSGVRLSRHVLPAMLLRKWGRIVFISSESGVNIPENMIHYGTTKSAMLSISNGLAKLTRGTQVTVNTILGGPTYSDGVANTVKHIAELQNVTEVQLKDNLIKTMNPTSLLQRFIEPSEIASLVVYLCSPLSVATNGAALRADGGVLTTIL